MNWKCSVKVAVEEGFLRGRPTPTSYLVISRYSYCWMPTMSPNKTQVLFVAARLVVHLMTTSRNLFQSAGLYLLNYIASPLISLINSRSMSISFAVFASGPVSGTSIKHFSIKLYSS